MVNMLNIPQRQGLGVWTREGWKRGTEQQKAAQIIRRTLRSNNLFDKTIVSSIQDLELQYAQGKFLYFYCSWSDF